VDPFVSKIPRDYKLRVLARLLPTADVVARMTKEQLRETLDTRTKLERLIEADPIRFWVPTGAGQVAFVNCEDRTKSTLLFVAGNKSGKTTCGAILLGERLCGEALWGREHRTHVKYPTPARGIVFAEDFDSHREVTIPTIRSWLPKGFIKREMKNPAGHVVEHGFVNGSVIHYRTYEQGSFKVEGKDWDIAWCDEPPPRDLYTAVARGLVVNNGRLVITATLLKEAWIYDEQEHEHVAIFEGSIHENTWISQRAKKAFLDSLTDEERAVRETGRPMSLTGVVYKRFVDGPPFVIPLRDVPLDVPIIVAVDPHERRPCHVEYGYIDKQDRVVWFDWCLVGGSLTEIFNKLATKESQMPSRPVLCVMDPNRGMATQIDERSWKDEFETAGYNVVLPNDKLAIGHTILGTYLQPDAPKMFWMESCRGKLGPIYQMQRYAWDDWARRSRMERSQKEVPKNQYKDFPDLHRYVAMMNLRYDDLTYGPLEIELEGASRERGAIRAYT
jgi:phage terminase large subunit-like protein